jgi:hypothetical protein
MTATGPRIELLWCSGCPSTQAMRHATMGALAELGLDGIEVDFREVLSEEQAAVEGFVGSPTLRVDGRDPFPADPDEHRGLTCRVYRLRDGRFSPTPDPDDLRDALRSALGSKEPT